MKEQAPAQGQSPWPEIHEKLREATARLKIAQGECPCGGKPPCDRCAGEVVAMWLCLHLTELLRVADGVILVRNRQVTHLMNALDRVPIEINGLTRATRKVAAELGARKKRVSGRQIGAALNALADKMNEAAGEFREANAAMTRTVTEPVGSGPMKGEPR